MNCVICRDEISCDDLIEIQRKIGNCKRCHSELGFMDEENYSQNENTHECESIKKIKLQQKHIRRNRKRCEFCARTFTNLRDLKKHMRRSHRPRVVPRPQIPRARTIVVDGDTIPEDIPEDYRHIFQSNWRAIRTHFHIGNTVQERYTFRIPDQSMIDQGLESLWPYFRENMFQRQRQAFKIRVAFGFILRREGNEDESPVLYRYFHPDDHSNYLYLGPETMRDRTEFDQFLIDIQRKNIRKWSDRLKSESAWVVESVCNVEFYINPLRYIPIGIPEALPEFIISNKGLCSLYLGRHGPFRDNLCFLRCVALHQQKLQGITKKRMDVDPSKVKLSRICKELFGTQNIDSFPGVTIHDLNLLEKKLKTNINVYQLDECYVATMIRRGLNQFEHTLNLNLFRQHFSYIHNFNMYANIFQCKNTCCQVFFQNSHDLRRHHCKTLTEVFPGKIAQPQTNVFAKLEDEGLSFQPEDKVFPYRGVFDYESSFSISSLPKSGPRTTFLNRHVAMAVGVQTNVPGFSEFQCFIGEPEQIVQQKLEYLEKASAQAYELLKRKFSFVYEFLEVRLIDLEEDERKKHPLGRLLLEFDGYLKCLPVCTFNGGRYDIPLVMKPFIKVLTSYSKIQFVVKKGNNYMCIVTESLKFLDITNYLPAGTSYSAYLDSYNSMQKKGFFPYEYITSPEVLNETTLPPRSAFYSSLTEKHLSEQDYQLCQRVWVENGMTTIRDFLIWYVRKDVEPFLSTLQTQINFYWTLSVDMLKDSISIPSITLKYLLSTLERGIFFSLIEKRDADLHRLIRENITGGASIIFTRYHEKGITRIRNQQYQQQAKLCQTVLGLDVNGLYLHALAQPMPTSTYIRYKRDGDSDRFIPKIANFYGRMSYEWLSWEEVTRGCTIRHMFNGTEKRIGDRALPSDGWLASENTIFSFFGCYWHGCCCQEQTDLMKKRSEETEKNLLYLRGLGFTVITMRECHWKQIRKQEDIQAILRDRIHLTQAFRNLTTSKALKKVRDGTFFGLVRCDIAVPPRLQEEFADIPPIYKNTEISLDDVGPFMKTYAEQNGMLKQPRRWYLEKGVEVTRIYEMVQYTPNTCFKTFADTVTDHRRNGEGILPAVFKLMGNCSYGKTLLAKDKHFTIKYCNEESAIDAVADPSYVKVNQIDEDLYEVTMKKKRVIWNLPIQIGFFVYGYSKLHMLRFYYDFLKKYIDPQNMELILTDTDSYYLALSAPDLGSAVRKDRLREFYSNVHLWLPSKACDDHREEFIQSGVCGEVWDNSDKACCRNREIYDRRTLGLSKVEFQGDGCIALCSKTYYTFGRSGCKLACKGLSKKLNHFTKQRYMNVLLSQTSGKGINRGFISRNNQVFTYEQERRALSYLYIKRTVLDDGISTKPLSI
ncbi:uncharacterized protein LOC143461131 isoform X2 [Clavelina lepadiformis]|uniref:uncharacterized protein LOC143461131 isoform X2 n=1 Tax=Clavelina lepadiformis TaxID=159417 RepID=UPI004041557C